MVTQGALGSYLIFMIKVLATSEPADFKLKTHHTSGQTVYAQSGRESTSPHYLFLIPVSLIPPQLCLSLCDWVLRSQNTRSVDCIVKQGNEATPSTRSCISKRRFRAQPRGGNVCHGRALSGAWDGLRGQEFMALDAVGSLQSCKV